MPDAQRVDQHDRLARQRHVAAILVGHLEAVATARADPDVRLRSAIGNDLGHVPAVRRADEPDPEASSMAEIGGMNDIDDGDNVPVSPISIEREENRQQPKSGNETQNGEDRQE